MRRTTLNMVVDLLTLGASVLTFGSGMVLLAIVPAAGRSADRRGR